MPISVDFFDGAARIFTFLLEAVIFLSKRIEQKNRLHFCLSFFVSRRHEIVWLWHTSCATSHVQRHMTSLHLNFPAEMQILKKLI